MNNIFSLNRFFSAVLSAGILAGSLFTSAAYAADDEYLQVGTIKGSSTAKGYENWIDVLSFSWGVSSTSTIGSGTGAGAGKAKFSDFSWTQYIDKSTPPIFADIGTGTKIGTITFDVTKPKGEGGQQKFFEMTFTNAFITSLSFSGSSAAGTPTLEGTFDYQKIKIEYWPASPDGKLGTGIYSTFDLVKNQGSPGTLVGLYALGLSETVNPVAEPSTYALMLAGLGLIGFIAYRRKNDSTDMLIAA